MSRKPQIKLSYPNASELAMMLTDAMIRRAPGKRVVETTREDKSNTDEGGSLLDGLDSVRTSTGVEMTLTLDPNSMDYALQQLIRPNLTEEEKKVIFGDSASTDEMLPGSAPAEDHTAPDQKKQIEIGKIPDAELRNILTDMIVSMNEGTETADAIDTAVNEINHRAGVIDLDETYNPDPLILKRDIEAIIQGSLQDNIPSLEHHNIVMIADDMARRLNLHTQIECDPNRGYDRNDIEIAIATLICAAQEKDWSREDLAAWVDHIIAMLNPNDFTHASEPSYLATKDISMYIAKGEIHLGLKDIDTAKRLSEELHQEAYQERNKNRQVAEQTKPAKKTRKKKTAMQDLSWDDVEKAARSLGKNKADRTDKTDKTDDIEPGLLNDIEKKEEP